MKSTEQLIKNRAYKKKWYKTSEKGRARRKARRKIYNEKHGRLRMYRYQARKRGLVFELTREQFATLTSQRCFYCGHSGKVGVDRKDNEQGYTLQNSVPCCGICNFMKKAATYDDFIACCKRIALRH